MGHRPSHCHFSKADRYPLEAVFSHRPTLLKDIFLKNKCSGSPAEAFLSKTSVRGVPPKHFYQKQVFGESRWSIFLKNKHSGSPAEAFFSKTSVRGVPPKYFS